MYNKQPYRVITRSHDNIFPSLLRDIKLAISSGTCKTSFNYLKV